MSRPKHTPGPWTLVREHKLLYVVEPNSDLGICKILEEFPGQCEVPEDIANAHLIAAAPDAVPLFEDLQEYLCEHGGVAVELLERIDAWLAKARGTD